MTLERKLSRLIKRRDDLKGELHRLEDQISYLEEEIRISKTAYQDGPGVYIIKCHDLYKIGKADDLRYRLSGLQTGCPYELRVVNFIPCGENENGRLERALHARFEFKRHRGEWYKLSVVDLNDIETLKAERENGYLLDRFISGGPFSANRVMSNEDQIDKFIKDTIRTEQKATNQRVLVSLVLDQCEKAGISRDAVEKSINEMRYNGDLFEPRPGEIKLP